MREGEQHTGEHQQQWSGVLSTRLDKDCQNKLLWKYKNKAAPIKPLRLWPHEFCISASGHDFSLLFEMGRFLRMAEFLGLFQGECLDTAPRLSCIYSVCLS